MKQFISLNKLVALLIPAALLLAFTTIANRADFTGSWKLDEAKSELGDFGAFAPRTLKAAQKDSAITITRTVNGFDGGDPVTSTLTISYDGKVTESEGFGGSKVKSSGKWSEDGQTFTISSTILFDMNGQSNEFKISEAWSLTKEGQLLLVTNSNTPMGESTTKAIYVK